MHMCGQWVHSSANHQINACVQRDGQGAWRVHVTIQHAWHNHEISAAIYDGYPEVRNALGADVVATVNILRKADAQRKKIHEYIVENTAHRPRMKDVHNLLSRLERTDTSSSNSSSSRSSSRATVVGVRASE